MQFLCGFQIAPLTFYPLLFQSIEEKVRKYSLWSTDLRTSSLNPLLQLAKEQSAVSGIGFELQAEMWLFSSSFCVIGFLEKVWANLKLPKLKHLHTYIYILKKAKNSHFETADTHSDVFLKLVKISPRLVETALSSTTTFPWWSGIKNLAEFNSNRIETCLINYLSKDASLEGCDLALMFAAVFDRALQITTPTLKVLVSSTDGQLQLREASTLLITA